MAFEGRLETAIVTEPAEGKYAYGLVGSTSVKILNAGGLIGEECTVRGVLPSNRYHSSEEPYTTRFISKDLVGSLASDKYVLCGVYPFADKGGSKHLTIWDINEVFDPGDMSVVYYLSMASTRYKGRRVITSQKNQQIPNLEKVIRDRSFPPHQRSNRVVVVGHRSVAYMVEQTMRTIGARLVFMTPLNKI